MLKQHVPKTCKDEDPMDSTPIVDTLSILQHYGAYGLMSEQLETTILSQLMSYAHTIGSKTTLD